MSFATVVGFLAVGFLAGVLSGMFGVGGAVISTPGIRALGASPIEAVGSTIPAILPAAISGAHRYAKAGLVDWRIAWSCGVAGTILAIAGAKVSDVVDARWLMVATAALLMWSGVSSITKGIAMTTDHDVAPAEGDEGDPVDRDPVDRDEDSRALSAPELGSRAFRSATAAVSQERLVTAEAPTAGSVAPAPAAAPARVFSEHRAGPDSRTSNTRSVTATPSIFVLAGVGALAGFVAGLLGIGGGVIMMPLFTNVLRLPVKAAVGSSLVAVAIFSVPAMVSHAVLGHIDWAVALLLVAGTVPGARLGSTIAIGTTDRRMRLLLGGFFCLIAILYGGRELVGIL